MVRIKTVVGQTKTKFQDGLEVEGYIWRFNELSPAGHLFDDVVHKYAMALWLFPEEIRSVQAVVRQGPLFFETPTAALWEYDRDDLLGLMEVTYAPNMFMRSEAFGADEFFEIQGTDGFIWVTRYTGQMLDLPPIMLYDAQGRTTTFAEVDASWVNSFRHSAAHFVDSLVDGPPARDGRRDGDQGAAALLRRLPGVDRAGTGRPGDDRRIGLAALVAPVQAGLVRANRVHRAGLSRGPRSRGGQKGSIRGGIRPIPVPSRARPNRGREPDMSERHRTGAPWS